MIDFSTQIARLLQELYAVPGHEEGLSAFIARLSREAGAVRGLLVHHDSHNKQTSLSYGFNFEPHWARAYADHFQYLNSYLSLPHATARKHCGVALLSELISDAEVEKIEFFNDYVVPQGVTIRNALLRQLGRGIALLLFDPERNRQVPTGLLRHRYQLTAAEERIALRLLQGQDIKEIADCLRLSRETVRAHLRAIFRKTETRRQSELISRLLQGRLAFAGALAASYGADA